MTYPMLRMPPEWHPQDWLWIGFPHDPVEWPGFLGAAQEQIDDRANLKTVDKRRIPVGFHMRRRCRHKSIGHCSGVVRRENAIRKFAAAKSAIQAQTRGVRHQ